MMTWNNLFFQSPSSIMMESIIQMHDYVMMFLFTVMLSIFFKLVNLSVIKSMNFMFFEHHELEAVWTLVPFFILTMIALPSLSSLYMLDSCYFCGMSIMITGHQWYWAYYIKNINSIDFNSYMLPAKDSIFRLMDTDNRLIVPTNLPVRFMTTSSDVIHSWTIPSLGFKMDAIPGRINQFCTSTKKSGIYFGQCSEICGANHSFMPIVLESVSTKNI